MATFFKRQYMRPAEAVGNTEKVLGGFILFIVAAVVAAFVFQVATDRDYLFEVDRQAYTPLPPIEATSPFPAPGLEGWRAPEQVDRFTAETLYVKIDGRAEAYLKFHVVGLTFGRYCHESDTERTVDVYWYDMGTPSNALGMYKSEEASGATPVSIGRAGQQVGGAVFFRKSSSYVQVLPSSLAEADARAALSIAERLAERIKE